MSKQARKDDDQTTHIDGLERPTRRQNQRRPRVHRFSIIVLAMWTQPFGWIDASVGSSIASWSIRVNKHAAAQRGILVRVLRKSNTFEKKNLSNVDSLCLFFDGLLGPRLCRFGPRVPIWPERFWVEPGLTSDARVDLRC